jgi:PAS domain-containing protein
VLSDEDMTIILANQNFYRISGYSQDAELKFTDLIHPVDLEFMVDCHRREESIPDPSPEAMNQIPAGGWLGSQCISNRRDDPGYEKKRRFHY